MLVLVNMHEGQLTSQIIGAAIEVHKHWGPGLYEDIYEKSLCHELTLRQIPYRTQVNLPLVYKGETVGHDFRLDLLINEKVIIEIKAITRLEAIHEAQLLTYLKLTKCKIGLLINFNVPILRQGIRRMVL